MLALGLLLVVGLLVAGLAVLLGLGLGLHVLLGVGRTSIPSDPLDADLLLLRVRGDLLRLGIAWWPLLD